MNRAAFSDDEVLRITLPDTRKPVNVRASEVEIETSGNVHRVSFARPKARPAGVFSRTAAHLRDAARTKFGF